MNSTRRGGDPIEAMHHAVLEHLAEHGPVGLDLDSVPLPHGLGREDVHDHWATIDDLVVESLLAARPWAHGQGAPPGTSLREDLVFLLDEQARDLDRLAARALLPILAQRERWPELADRVTAEVMVPRQQRWLEAVAAAVDRGEVKARALNPRVVAVGPRLLVAEDLDAHPVPHAELEALVDEVLLPLLTR